MSGVGIDSLIDKA